MTVSVENSPEQLFDGKTLEERLKSCSPMFAVLCVNSDGTLSGKVEHSFSMGKSLNRLNVFWSGTGYSFLGTHKIDGKSWAAQNCDKSKGWFVVELNTEDCPVEVDWVSWLTADNKFARRNALFKMREGFDFSEQAKEAAKREAFEQQHEEIMKSVSVQDKAEEIYNQTLREAQKVREASTASVKPELDRLRRQYQAKAKRIAVEKGRCPKLPDGRYMNTGNARVTSHGIQLKWFSAGQIVYTVPWKDLF